jgi:hypothetical protein
MVPPVLEDEGRPCKKKTMMTRKKKTRRLCRIEMFQTDSLTFPTSLMRHIAPLYLEKRTAQLHIHVFYRESKNHRDSSTDSLYRWQIFQPQDLKAYARYDVVNDEG